MPQVQVDPTLNPGVITNGGTDLFAYPNVQQASVLGLQAPATQPLPPGTGTATNLLNPDLQVISQLRNFPSNVYDTSPDSLLVHFMTALLGNSGTGQLRKRQMVARLQQAITSTQFYDLDAFYGALFGAQRGPSGALPDNPSTSLPVNPYTDLASPDAWDEIEAADAKFRERIIQLARAITLGATVPGMQALAEAVTGVPCLIWEIWRLLDNSGTPAPGYQTWGQVTASYPLWSSFPGTATWLSVEGAVNIAGLTGNGAPNEILLRPKKHYSSSVTDTAHRGADTFGILSVVEVLKPAASLITVDTAAPGIAMPVQISSAWADSQYWEVVHLVTPPNAAVPAYQPMAASYQGADAASLPQGTYIAPRPALSRTSGTQYSYTADVTTVSARAVTDPDPGIAQVTDGQDFQVIIFPGQQNPGGTVQYVPAQSVLPPQQAQTARTASPVSVIAAPYSGPRVPVTRAS